MSRYRSRASRDAAMYAALALDARRPDLREKPRTVVDQDREEHRDALRHDHGGYRRVGNELRDEADVPDEEEL